MTVRAVNITSKRANPNFDLLNAVNCWELVRAELKEWERQILEYEPEDDKEAGILFNFRRFVG